MFDFNYTPDEAYILRRKKYETFSITLDARVDPNEPIGRFFVKPIHVALLDLTPQFAKLGIQADLGFHIDLDGFVDDAWKEQMKKELV